MGVLAADAKAIARAAEVLREGGLVAFPTETVYGLGADASNPDAVRRVFAAKGRPADHPVIVHVQDEAAARRWSRAFPPGAAALARAFWPGPLTLIVPRAAHVHDVVTGGQDSVGLRVPSHPVARALLAAFGGGIAAPSANRFGHVSPTQAAHVVDDLGDAVALVLDGGPSEVGIESTIVSFVTDPPELLRPGGIALDALEHVLGHALPGASRDAPRASGTLIAHYAPRTPASFVATDVLHAELLQLCDRDERIAVMARSPAPDTPFDGIWIEAPDDAARYAHDLYDNLRRLDAAEADVILVEAVPEDGEWLAIHDRLTRATHGVADDRD
jgi:L-threonylcarbamoyladenylate synthase